jgi:SpoVK/Ycf46/Vps4 family AAA+-type ATPase
MGLESLADGEVDRQFIHSTLKWAYDNLGRKRSKPQEIFSSNIKRLSTLLDLSPAEQLLLQFLASVQEAKALEDSTDLFGDLSRHKLVDVLHHILRLRRTEIVHSLSRSGSLHLSGLINVQPGSHSLKNKLSPLNGLSDALFSKEADLFEMFRGYFQPSSVSELTLDDFPHLREDIALLRSFLTSAKEGRTIGINILLYGDTGTGKTEFVRAMVTELGGRLYEVSTEDMDGDCKSDEQRFRAYRLGQRVLARAPGSVLLFDEVEDVFPKKAYGFFGALSESGPHKAWTNRLLESNPVPAFWLSNEIMQIDPAFRRRFTYCLEFRTPPCSVRRQILTRALHDVPVTPEWISRIAQSEYLTPALSKQAARVAKLSGLRESGAIESLVERAIQNSFEVMGLRRALPALALAGEIGYRLDVLNPSHDLVQLTEGLVRRPQGRLCLYGPPGSGKTAFAYYLAQRLDKTLIRKNASELLSMWVGETEKNLARMFRQARSENGLLLLDEADSFLQDRTQAHRSWEVTQVNELLVQMEAFDGLFLCSTNLMQALDAAVLRRFDLKIHFHYLKAEHAWSLFEDILAALQVSLGESRVALDLQHRLRHLDTVTPGDFAMTLRQAKMLGCPSSAEQLLTALEVECRAKQRGAKPVLGFRQFHHETTRG